MSLTCLHNRIGYAKFESVYFVAMKKGRSYPFVKIGYTNALKRRITHIQTCTPLEMAITQLTHHKEN